MVWNAVNDPLFGYLQDNSRVPCCSQRRLSILYGAPFYAIAFLLAWFPWQEYAPGDWMSGVHLMVALCAFNGMLTFVLLAQCALFAEISGHHQSRLRLIKYNQVGKGGVLCTVFFYTFYFSLYMVFILLSEVSKKCSHVCLLFPLLSPGGVTYRFLQCSILRPPLPEHG